MNPRLDPIFDATRMLFELPDGLVYLDGNSLGPLPKASRERVNRVIDEQWSAQLIKGWNDSGWIDLPQKVGDRIAGLVGAPAGSVIAGDSTSVNLFKVLTAALGMQLRQVTGNPEGAARRVILTDTGNFPNDLYVAQGVVRALNDTVDGSDAAGYELRIVEPEQVADAIDESIAVVMLTQTDYRTGRLHDMALLTARAHESGALTIWDLAHSAGAMPVHLESAGADFAIGCGYKYLNGGPGAPAFVYVRPEHAAVARPALVGWMGHETPFAFDLEYRPAPTTDRMLVGTPPILAMASLDAALDAWDGIDLADVRERSIELTELFIAEVEARCPELELASPRDPQVRGSHVSFRFPDGYAVMQALIANDVIGDFRAPDMMRFGFTPLYLGVDDVIRGAQILETVLRKKLWDRPEYKRKSKVT